MAKDIIAIDFGTSNTYFTLCSGKSHNKTPLHLDGETPAISTVVLYSDPPTDDQMDFPIIGDEATHIYGDASPEEIAENAYCYASHFKPDIADCDPAYTNSVDFLKCVLRDADRSRHFLEPERKRVIIGVPCDAGNEYRNALKAVAEAAGFGQVELIEEPKGAMLNDLWNCTFPAKEVMAGYLVIDFGGGTTDFAFMQNGKVVHHWGEPHLGGRLFDDLFYQWFCEQNPGQEEALRKSGLDFFVRTYYCRELKEKFSNYVTQRPNPFRKQVGNYGFVEWTKTEFEQRAKCYTPSRSFRDFAEKTGAALPPELQKGNIDLIDWFRNSLLDGMKDGRISRQDIRVVSLAGGGSRWFFVKDICREYLKIDDPKRYPVSPNPFAAISEGLAMLSGVQEQFAKKKQKLEEKKTEFLQEQTGRLQNEMKRFREEVTEHTHHDYYKKDIVPILRECGEGWFSVGKLHERIAEKEKEYGETIESFVKSKMEGKTRFLSETSYRKVCELIEREVGDYPHVPRVPVKIAAPHFDVGILRWGILLSLTFFFGLLGIIGGFVGFLVGAAIPVTITSIIWLFKRRWILDDIPVPPWILKWIYTDSRIENLGENLKKRYAKSIQKVGTIEIGQIRGGLEQAIQNEIDQLAGIPNTLT